MSTDDKRNENQPTKDRKSSALQPGTQAPDFTLHTTPDQAVSLSDFRGQPVIIAFYPAEWSSVCGDQMTLYNEVFPEFRRYKAELMGISVNGVWCHAAFAQSINIKMRWTMCIYYIMLKYSGLMRVGFNKR